MGVWIETMMVSTLGIKTIVTPFVGVWIETLIDTANKINEIGHTLRGCVD